MKLSLPERLFHLRMAVSAARYVPRLPFAMPEDLFPGIDELAITMQHSVRERALMHGEAYVLSLITAYVSPKSIFEIGTASGQGALLMARQAPDAQVETLDLGASTPTLGTQKGEPPVGDIETIGHAFKNTSYEGQIRQHFGDSATFDYGPFKEKMDLVFVDGAHTYDYVRADSESALSLIGKQGVVIWDDCNYLCPGVSRALLELTKTGLKIHRVIGTRFAVTCVGY